MKPIKSLLFTILSIFIIISCSQFGDSLRLPGENPKDIVFYQLDNDYLAPESKEFIESNYPSNQVNISYVLVGKKLMDLKRILIMKKFIIWMKTVLLDWIENIHFLRIDIKKEE